jgi:murein DD-endopeptidase MepM/ murein hydrolase activator NlpD
MGARVRATTAHWSRCGDGVHRSMKTRFAFACALCLASNVALAEPRVNVQPKTAKPGDAVLITVTGANRLPKGTAGDKPLHFFRAKAGYQALFSVPIDAVARPIAIEIDNAHDKLIQVRSVDFPETDVIVEEEYANPPPAERRRIDEDNKAIVAAMAKHNDGGPQFTRAFSRPRGEITSRFGEWRTFNDGHRSQHLGMDVFAREGTKVKAINAGTVTLVRDTFLAGNVVVVAHGGGIASAYFHLSEINVDEGDVVQVGEVVGLAGQTGRTTGPHLHLGVRVHGGFVDPATFFRLRISPATPVAARRAQRRQR